MPRPEPSKLLQQIEQEARSKANFSMPREGLFRGVLKAAFIRSFEFAKSVQKYTLDQANEEAFFLSAALRGTCEDLIVLKFIRRLKRKDRDEVIQIKMLVSTGEAIGKQAAFFRKTRPFQPVIQNFVDQAKLDAGKDRLTVIGQQSKLWNTSKKLPPVEQMAKRVHLGQFYEFIYAVTSEMVHFSVRVALRSGWGKIPKQVSFSTKNFCRYYLEFSQFYSMYMLTKFCRTFRKDLHFSDGFMDIINEIEETLDERLRWPEAVTFEEMNQQNPNELMRAVLKVAHQEKANRHRVRTRRRSRNSKTHVAIP
jgi:hypothetical protein